MKKISMIFIFALIFVLITAIFLIFRYFYVEDKKSITSAEDCLLLCIKEGYFDGECNWPSLVDENQTSIGSCVVSESDRCNTPEKCNCYCFEEPIE